MSKQYVVCQAGDRVDQLQRKLDDIAKLKGRLVSVVFRDALIKWIIVAEFDDIRAAEVNVIRG